MRKRILVFASGSIDGGGSGFQVLVEASRDNRLYADIVGVVSNHAEGGVYQKAKALGILFRYFAGPWEAEEYQKIVVEFHPDLVCLSGWLKPVVGLDSKATINIHPGPLPRFGGKGMYGHHVHEAVMEAFHKGEITHSAVTMHFVIEKYDEGPVFFRLPIEILTDDTPETLAKRVNQAEHQWQPIITNLIVNGVISWDGVRPESLIAYHMI